MSILLGLLLTIAIWLFYQGFQRIRTPGYEAYLARFSLFRPKPRPRTRYERWVKPFALRLANFSLLRVLTDLQKVGQQLNYAGNPAGMTAHELYGAQVFGAIVGLVIGLAWASLGLPFSQFALFLLPIGGFYYPSLWLRGRVQRRQRAITVALPDMLDMLAVCISAGMGFDVALTLIVERSEGPLYEEMDRLLHELRIGEPRHLAFRHVTERNLSKDLHSFIAALLQAEELGTPVATALERQAEDMRIARLHRAREEGVKISHKISMILAFLLLPSIMCLFIGSFVITFFQEGSGLFDTFR
jgi:tight adherence protein C